MAWGKVDDKLHASVKWRRANKGARALWTTALSWCSDQENGGQVPSDMLKVLDGTPADAKSLVTAGLWDTTSEGWEFHDWAEYNPDSASAKAVREAKSDGGKQGNHTRWHVKRKVKVPGCEFCESDNSSHTDRISESGANRPGANPPDPTRPDPSHTRKNSTAAVAAAFDAFWETYPKKVGKGDAEKAFTKAVKRAGLDPIMAGVRRLANDPNLPDKQFIPNPSTWLNQDRWTDEPYAPRTDRPQPQASEAGTGFWGREIA